MTCALIDRQVYDLCLDRQTGVNCALIDRQVYDLCLDRQTGVTCALIDRQVAFAVQFCLLWTLSKSQLIFIDFSFPNSWH